MARDRAAGPEAKPLRLFVAVDVPDPIKAGLEETVSAYRDRIPGARWTRPDGWHVTLKFLGGTWPRLVEDVRAAVAGAAGGAEPFESRLTELGVFPSKRRARVVWAGLLDPDGRLAGIAKDLDERLADHFLPEERQLTPHLTVARLAPPRDLAEFAPDLVGTAVTSAPFRVDRLVLYRSRLSPRGATYEAMESAQLGGA